MSHVSLINSHKIELVSPPHCVRRKVFVELAVIGLQRFDLLLQCLQLRLCVVHVTGKIVGIETHNRSRAAAATAVAAERAMVESAAAAVAALPRAQQPASAPPPPCASE